MPKAILVAVVLFAASGAMADCIENGHYTIATAAHPLIGTRYPYTEDLAPVQERTVVAYHDDLRWTQLRGGCEAFDEKNLLATGPSNVMLHASLRLRHDPETVAARGTRYQVQLRVGETAVATETRRFTGRAPFSERFAAVVRDLPAGNYRYSMWIRLLDEGQLAIDLPWITAQGAPNVYSAARIDVAADAIAGGDWGAVGPPMSVDNNATSDVILQSSFTVVDSSASQLGIGFTLDGKPLGDKFGTVGIPDVLPNGLTAFDDRIALPRGRHTLQLVMRSQGGLTRITGARAELVSFPSRLRRPEMIDMQRAMETTPLFAAAEGDAVQPPISPVCGRWSKILEFDMVPSFGSWSWTLEGYVEIRDVVASGYGQIAIVNVHDEDAGSMSTDMGIFDIQALPGGDGIYFYGDCSKWGNFGQGHMSLWIRRIEGCNDAPFGGGFEIGKRWLAVKLIPSEGRHLQ